jgi:NADP-dependent 3-hydroxy acid dehydrogenase YdfG
VTAAPSLRVDLSGLVAFVTGAAGGIGQATAATLANGASRGGIITFMRSLAVEVIASPNLTGQLLTTRMRVA